MCWQQVAFYKDAGPEVDVWSQAASLYYLLTGCTPRDFGEDDKWLAILETDSVPITKRRSRLRSRLAEVIDAALKEDRRMAFKTVGAFKKALEKAVLDPCRKREMSGPRTPAPNSRPSSTARSERHVARPYLIG